MARLLSTRMLSPNASKDKAFQESEQRFRLFADSAPVLIWMSGTNKLCTYFNKPWLDFTGRSIEQELGNGWAEGVHPSDLQRCLDIYTRSFDRRDEFRMEYRLRRRDGEYRWILDSGVPRYSPDRSFAGYIGSCIDVTELKRAEGAIRESEERYRRIVETTNEGVWLLDAKLHTIYVNRQMAKMLRYAPEEMVGQSVFNFYFREDLAHKRDILSRRQQGLPEQLEERFRRKDGSELWARMSATPIFKENGEFEGAFAMMSDITDRKLTEEALRASEERLRLAQWAAHIGTFDLNFRTGVDIWTPETEALYGLPPGGFAGSLDEFENLIHPEDRERVRELTRELMKTGQASEGEWRVIWPDGSVHWIAGRGQVLMDESGKPLRMLGVNMDITARKQAEEALSNMTRKLVQAQEQERSRIGRELHDDVSQRLAMLSIELGQLRDENNMPVEFRERLQELKQMASDITMGVHSLSHELHSSTMEYLGLVSAMRSWCEEYGTRHKLKIEFESEEVPKLPQETSLCLLRVLQEALHNAAKYSGVSRIEVQLTEKSGEVHLVVHDSGKGFDIEAARQKRSLGLTSMQERVRLVGGTLVIDSGPQAGTTVHVSVPVVVEHH
jgi:PAS domain S-box-containing protein